MPRGPVKAPESSGNAEPENLGETVFAHVMSIKEEKMFRTILPLSLPILAAVAAVSALAADLPIREVILYKHGVAYFERSGDLKPGDTARLDFKSEDMNDVLKSLTITDQIGRAHV